MAQSIYVTLETLSTETSVPQVTDKDGKVLRENFGSVAHTLPRENYPTPDIFDDEELFLDWAQERGALLSLLQSGLNDWLISDRATFKRMPTKDSGKVWSVEFGQEAINNREWTVAKRPNQSGTKKVTDARLSDCLAMIGKLTENGMDKNTIEGIVTPIYGDDIVSTVFGTLESLKSE